MFFICLFPLAKLLGRAQNQLSLKLKNWPFDNGDGHLKALNENELDSLVDTARKLKGAQLQEVLCFDTDLALGHWTGSQLRWLWIDLSNATPSFWVLDQLPPSAGPRRRQPVQLFIKAHGLRQPLTEIRREVKLGRVLTFVYGESLTMEFRAIPRSVNLLVRGPEGKSVSWAKVKALKPQQQSASESAGASAEELKEQWWRHRWGRLEGRQKGPSQGVKAEQLRRQLERMIQKKEKALVQVEEACKAQSDPSWRDLGHWLLQNQQFSFARKSELPVELQARLVEENGLAWNIDQCFAKAKALEAKIEGSQNRRQTLLAQLKELQSISPSNPELEKILIGLTPGAVPKKGAQASAQRPRSFSGQRRLRCRKMAWEDGQEFFVGLSAQDNMELLRQARAWDMWLHLRDQPGAHGILRRERRQQVSDDRLKEAGLFLISNQKGLKPEPGERWALMVAERRFVQPIKGDSLGRVQVRNERSIFLKT